jgi:phosphoenolpyruvate-protein kinase (PTS system EI component)
LASKSIPAVLRVWLQAVIATHSEGRKTGICGEAAVAELRVDVRWKNGKFQIFRKNAEFFK